MRDGELVMACASMQSEDKRLVTAGFIWPRARLRNLWWTVEGTFGEDMVGNFKSKYSSRILGQNKEGRN